MPSKRSRRSTPRKRSKRPPIPPTNQPLATTHDETMVASESLQPARLASKTTDAPWITAYCEPPPRRRSSENPLEMKVCPVCTAAPSEKRFRHTHAGKWLLFVDRGNIDEVWRKIAGAIAAGRLGAEGKVSTARPNPHARKPGKHVICVYTYDWRDTDDVMSIRQELRRP